MTYPTEEVVRRIVGRLLRSDYRGKFFCSSCLVKLARESLDTTYPKSEIERAKELRAANIAVQAKAKKADGIQHPLMCGASTGTMNVYRIDTSDWEKARVLGFVLYIEGISIARD